MIDVFAARRRGRVLKVAQRSRGKPEKGVLQRESREPKGAATTRTTAAAAAKTEAAASCELAAARMNRNVLLRAVVVSKH